MRRSRCGYDIVYRYCVKQQINRYCPLLSSSSAAVINHNHLDSKWKSFFSQHEQNPIRSFVSNSSATTTKYNASSSIHGTIPLHGKGLKMGQYAEVHRTFTQEDVNLFGRLSGDMNPVHYPTTTTTTTSTTDTPTNDDNTKLPIVHGILLSSLFSNIFGTLIPGAIYRHQSLKFHNAVHVNERVVGRVVVTKLRQINRKGRGGNGSGGVLCTCDTSVIKILDYDTSSSDDNFNLDESNSEKEIVCISGDAQVWLPDLQLVYECREKGK